MTTTIEATLLKRAPVRLQDSELAGLQGYLSEIELASGHVLRFASRRVPLYYLTSSAALIGFQGHGGAKLRGGRPDRNTDAADAFTRWTGRHPQRSGSIRVRVRDRWWSFGTMTRIDYFSTKWSPGGTMYTHDTTTGPRLYRCGGSRPPWIWVVRGGGFRLTTRGLIG